MPPLPSFLPCHSSRFGGQGRGAKASQLMHANLGLPLMACSCATALTVSDMLWERFLNRGVRSHTPCKQRGRLLEMLSSCESSSLHHSHSIAFQTLPVSVRPSGCLTRLHVHDLTSWMMCRPSCCWYTWNGGYKRPQSLTLPQQLGSLDCLMQHCLQTLRTDGFSMHLASTACFTFKDLSNNFPLNL